MDEAPVKKALMAGILVLLIIILATPFFINKPPPEFARAPVLRIDYVDNRTVYDVQSQWDYIYTQISATISWKNGTGMLHDKNSAENTYVLAGETNRSAFNITVTASDRYSQHFIYMGDVNITKFTLHSQFYVFLNITEHKSDWINRHVSVDLQGMPYKTALEAVRVEGG